MKYKFIAENNEKLIIFFNGWGMDEKIISHLDRTGFDLLVLYDYRDLNFDFSNFNLDKYSDKYIISWSMGVMVSTLFTFNNIVSRTAINGTLKPVDNKYGIPIPVYNLTIKGFSKLPLKIFIRKMFDGKPPLNKFSDRPLESQKEELIKLKSYNGNEEIKFDKVLVSDNDKIIPTKNQLNYWDNPEIIKGGHCPFFQYSSWKELL